MSKYGVFSGPYFPAFGLNMERYKVFIPNAGKYGPEKTPYLDTFHEMAQWKPFSENYNSLVMVSLQVYQEQLPLTTFLRVS